MDLPGTLCDARDASGGADHHRSSVDKKAPTGEEERVLAWLLVGLFRGDLSGGDRWNHQLLFRNEDALL